MALQTAYTRAATKVSQGQQVSMLDMWIPYKRVPNLSNLTYASVYNASRMMAGELWGPNLPSPGDECVHCYYDLCTDDDCGLKRNTHICSFPAGAPIMELQGFCRETVLGELRRFKRDSVARFLSVGFFSSKSSSWSP